MREPCLLPWEGEVAMAPSDDALVGNLMGHYVCVMDGKLTVYEWLIHSRLPKGQISGARSLLARRAVEVPWRVLFPGNSAARPFRHLSAGRPTKASRLRSLGHHCASSRQMPLLSASQHR
jgi:hypothetical protein